jgi:hypothetical protein
MKIRTFIAAVGTAALIGGTAAIVIPAAANAGTATQTLKFISETKSSVAFSRTNLGLQDTDVNSKGKTVGFDMLNSAVNLRAGTGTILVTVDARGGFLIGYLNYSSGKTLRGYATGGIGVFKGAFGPMTATYINKARTRISFVITYQV